MRLEPSTGTPEITITRLLPTQPTWSHHLTWLVDRYYHALDEEIRQTPAHRMRCIDRLQSPAVSDLLTSVAQHAERACVLLARAGEARMGYFLGMLKDCVGEIPRQVGYINGLYVEPTCRSGGLGSRLLHEGYAWFQSRGVTLVELYTAMENTPALRFWQKHGFFQTEIVMLARLPHTP